VVAGGPTAVVGGVCSSVAVVPARAWTRGRGDAATKDVSGVDEGHQAVAWTQEAECRPTRTRVAERRPV
jgi:hypothetical protein